MCGFVGIVNFTSSQAPAITEELLRRMGGPVAHRGPDGCGTFISPDGRVGLIHYRLAIVDIPGGAQPMSNEDGTVWVVYNGEIYNHRELRAELEKLGHRFKSDHCDTEVIVHAYEQYGKDCPKYFRGQFAFAVIDLKKRQFRLVRDQLGQKPLYWSMLPDETILFASSSECIRRHPAATADLNQMVLDTYLRRGCDGSSLTAGIWQEMPGASSWTEMRPQGLACCTETSWSAADAEEFKGPFHDAAAAVRRQLIEATEMRLEADVPVGMFLSGGTDSAVVASIIRQVLNRPIRTFTIGSPDPAYDERASARLMAAELGTEHTEFVVEPDHLLDVLDDLIEVVAEPFADSSIVPTYWVSRLTRQHVKVALSGDGGDEAFGGYDRYRAVRLAGCLRWSRPLWRVTWPMWRRIGGGGHRGFRDRLRRLADGLRRNLEDAYAAWVGVFDAAEVARLVRPEWQAPKDFAEAKKNCFASDPVAAAIDDDYMHYLPNDILTKVDRASMAVALEVRSPFLDQQVVELAQSLPSRWKLRGRQTKWILRKAFEDIVPASVWTEPKRGFGLPLDRWFRGELLPLLRESVAFLPDDVFNHDYIDELILAHAGGKAEHSQRLWALLWLGRWWRRFVSQSGGTWRKGTGKCKLQIAK